MGIDVNKENERYELKIKTKEGNDIYITEHNGEYYFEAEHSNGSVMIDLYKLIETLKCITD